MAQTTAAMVIDAANQMPMMSSRRIVVVREFDKIKEDEQELVLAYLQNPAPRPRWCFKLFRRISGASLRPRL